MSVCNKTTFASVYPRQGIICLFVTLHQKSVVDEFWWNFLDWWDVWLETKRLCSGGDPYHDLDSGISLLNFYHCGIDTDSWNLEEVCGISCLGDGLQSPTASGYKWFAVSEFLLCRVCLHLSFMLRVLYNASFSQCRHLFTKFLCRARCQIYAKVLAQSSWTSRSQARTVYIM